MATRKGINISGHNVVSINTIWLFIYVLCILKIETFDRIVFYTLLFLRLNDHPDTVF